MNPVVLFKIPVLVLALVSGIPYLVRRIGNKRRRKTFLSEATVLRSLTDVESELLAPFLVQGDKKLPLVSNEIRTLRGKFAQYEFVVNSQGASIARRHNTIGNIDVILPYDALEYVDVEGVNTAEVVMTDTYTIVVKLNGIFDLVSARQRSLASSGNANIDGKPWLKVISERNETAVEARARAFADNADGWPTSVNAMLMGLCMLAWASMNSIVIIIALALVFVALWRLLYLPKSLQPRSISRIEGILVEIENVPAIDSNKTEQHITIGGQQTIKVPLNWSKYVKPGEYISVDVCLEDQSVLRYGPILNIQEEEELFPIMLVQRYVALVAVSIISLFFVCLASKNLGNDFIQTGDYIRYMMADAGFFAETITHPIMAHSLTSVQRVIALVFSSALLFFSLAMSILRMRAFSAREIQLDKHWSERITRIKV